MTQNEMAGICAMPERVGSNEWLGLNRYLVERKRAIRPIQIVETYAIFVKCIYSYHRVRFATSSANAI